MKDQDQQSYFPGDKVKIISKLPEKLKGRTKGWVDALRELLNKEVVIQQVIPVGITRSEFMYKFSGQKTSFQYPEEVIECKVDKKGPQEPQEQPTVFIFIYGTLMKGQSNHQFMIEQDARYIKELELEGFLLYDIEGLPMAVISDDPLEKIIGELYEIPEANLEAFDQLEGHPWFYERQTIDDLVDYEEAFIYLGSEDLVKGCTEVPSGSWKQYAGPKDIKVKETKETTKPKEIKVYITRDEGGALTFEAPEGVKVFLRWEQSSSGASFTMPLTKKFSNDLNVRLYTEGLFDD